LPPPPVNIDQICDPVALAQNKVRYTQCEEVCEPAECCDYPATLPLSCLEEHTDMCMQYHSFCSALSATSLATLDGEVQKPPEQLETYCSPESIATNIGIRKCAEFCLPAECCWEQGVASCATQAKCAPYSPCLHLRAADTVHNSIPQNIASTCTKIESLDDVTACEEACLGGQCCFAADGGASCNLLGPDANKEAFCKQYAGCSVVQEGVTLEFTPAPGPRVAPTPAPTTKMAGTIPALPPGIGISCDATRIQEQDETYLTACKNDCAPADCCFLPSNMEQSCLNANQETCNKYQQFCGVLKSSAEKAAPQEKAVNVEKVNDLCSSDSLATLIGFSQCADICKPAACCWDENAPTHCRGTEYCRSYESCLHFKALTLVDPRIKTAIDTTCTAVRINEHTGLVQCELLCSHHKCCYNSQGCPFASTQVCPQYSACSILINAAPPVDQAVLPAFPSDLEEQCFALGNAAYQSECRMRCDAVKCCDIPENMASSCLKNNHDQCLEYHRACSALSVGLAQDMNVTIYNPHKNLADTCSPPSLATIKGHRHCHRQCDAAKCCFSKLLPLGQLPCTLSQRDECPRYSPCLNLAAEEFKDEAIVDEVETSCTRANIEDPALRAGCMAACQQHKCCWERRGNGKYNVADRRYETSPITHRPGACFRR
jgi:hypothetical protein